MSQGCLLCKVSSCLDFQRDPSILSQHAAELLYGGSNRSAAFCGKNCTFFFLRNYIDCFLSAWYNMDRLSGLIFTLTESCRYVPFICITAFKDASKGYIHVWGQLGQETLKEDHVLTCFTPFVKGTCQRACAIMALWLSTSVLTGWLAPQVNQGYTVT